MEAVDRALLPQVLQDTAWQLGFRQRGPQDARQLEALFGQAFVRDESWRSDGLTTTRMVERPRVSIDEWMNALEPGDAWLRVAPIDKGWRQERVRVALPQPRKLSSETALGNIDGNHGRNGARVVPEEGFEGAPCPPMPREPRRLPPVPPDCPQELIERMGVDILARVDRRWSRKHHELGPCLVWTGARQQSAAGKVYGKHYDKDIGKSDLAHRIVWRRCYGLFRAAWTSTTCAISRCASGPITSSS